MSERFQMLLTLAIGCLCTEEDMHKRSSLFSFIPENVVTIHIATKGSAENQAVIFYLNIGNIDKPYLWSLALIVRSGNHVLSTNYMLGTVLRGYGILKFVAVRWLIKAWLTELVEALGGKIVSTPNKAWSSEHGLCALCYIFPPHTHRCRVAFY